MFIAVYTAVYNGRVQRPCTRPSGPNPLSTCTGREHAVYTRPACIETVYTAVYTERVHGRVHDNVRGRISRVHGRGHVDGHGPCNGVQYTAVYIRPYMWHVHMARTRPCYVRAVNTAVYGPWSCSRPRPCRGRVDGCVPGPCLRPCTRPCTLNND